MWYKIEWIGFPVWFELTGEGLLVEFTSHCTTWDTQKVLKYMFKARSSHDLITLFIWPLVSGQHEFNPRIIHIYQLPPLGQDMTHGQFFSGVTGLNSVFSFSWTSCLYKAEETVYLPLDGGRIIVFIPFPKVLVLCEMQSVSSRIWTRVAVSISYDNNHYTTGTSYNHYTTGTSQDYPVHKV